MQDNVKARLINVSVGTIPDGYGSGTTTLNIHLFREFSSYADPYIIPTDNFEEMKFNDFNTSFPLYATQRDMMFLSRPIEAEDMVKKIFEILPNGFVLPNGNPVSLSFVGADAISNSLFIEKVLARIDRTCDVQKLVAPKELYLRTFASVKVYQEFANFLKQWEQRTFTEFKRHVNFENFVIEFDQRFSKRPEDSYENIVHQVIHGFRSTLKFEVEPDSNSFLQIDEYIANAKKFLTENSSFTEHQIDRGYYALSVAKIYIMAKMNNPIGIQNVEPILLELNRHHGFVYESKAFASGDRLIVA